MFLTLDIFKFNGTELSVKCRIRHVLHLCFPNLLLISKADADGSCLFDDSILRIYHFQLSCHILKRYFCNLLILHGDHVAVFLIQDQLCRSRSHSCGKYTVIRTWRTASLRMPRHRNPYFLVCLLLDLLCQFVGDGRIFPFCKLFLYILFSSAWHLLLRLHLLQPQ